MVQLMDFQERSLNGPVMKADEFDMAFSLKLRELVARYDIKYIPEEFIIDDKMAAGIKREKANAIAQTIMKKAEEEINKREEPARLLEFDESCDLITAKPKQEFLDLMNRTMDELVNLVMPYA